MAYDSFFVSLVYSCNGFSERFGDTVTGCVINLIKMIDFCMRMLLRVTVCSFSRTRAHVDPSVKNACLSVGVHARGFAVGSIAVAVLRGPAATKRG